MITTVTLNVSVDKAYYIKGIVVPGTVARVQKCVNSAGGKGLNVSRIIDFCGEEVLATGFAGGFNGAYVEDMLRKMESQADLQKHSQRQEAASTFWQKMSRLQNT